jgi:hypothetical protein
MAPPKIAHALYSYKPATLTVPVNDQTLIFSTVTDQWEVVDAATQAWVTNQIAAAIAGLAPKALVAVRAQAPVNVANLPANIDGVALGAGARFLADLQGGAINIPHVDNGIWVYQGAGNAATRPTDYPHDGHAAGAYFQVERGTNADLFYVCTTDRTADVIDTNPTAFAEFSIINEITDTQHGARGYATPTGTNQHPEETLSTPGFSYLRGQIIQKSVIPGWTLCAPGVVNLLASYAPTYGSYLPKHFLIPKKDGNVEPGIILTFLDALGVVSTTTTYNTLGASWYIRWNDFMAVKDDHWLVGVDFIATNKGAVPANINLEEFQFDGENIR